MRKMMYASVLLCAVSGMHGMDYVVSTTRAWFSVLIHCLTLAKIYTFGSSTTYYTRREEDGKGTAVYTQAEIPSLIDRMLHVIKTRLKVSNVQRNNVAQSSSECGITSIPTIPLLLPEILKKITEIACNSYCVKHYILRNFSSAESRSYAETILPMNLVHRESDKPAEGKKCHLDTDFLVSYHCILLRIGSMLIHDLWHYERSLYGGKVFFDGMNSSSKALMGNNKNKYEPCGYELAWFDLSSQKLSTKTDYRDRGTLSPFFESNTGELNALTLHQSSDEYVISGKNQSTVFIGNGVLGEPPRVIEIHEFFQKILHIKKSTYLGLLQGGRLASIYFDSNGSIEIATKRVLAEQGSTEEDFFVCLAVDNSYVVYTGTGDEYTPHVALLNERGEVFELDLLRPGQPKLILHSTIETRSKGFLHADSKTNMQEDERKPNAILRESGKFFYDKGRIGLTFNSKKSAYYDDLEIYPSTDGVTYLTKHILDTLPTRGYI
jgi:hypothetical protein